MFDYSKTQLLNPEKIKAYLTLFLILVFVFNSVGQYDRMVLERISVGQKLAKQNIFDITQDKHGFLWFCTSEGLKRYDGYDIEVFKQNNNQKGDITNIFIKSFLTKDQSTLWLRNHGGGLVSFDLNNYTFGDCFMDSNVQSKEDCAEIWSFCGDYKMDSILWLGAHNGGFYRYNFKEEVSSFYNYSPEIRAVFLQIKEIIPDQNGNLWILSHESGLVKYTHSTGRYKYYDLGFPYVDGNFSKTIFVTSDNEVYVGMSIKGVFKYDSVKDGFELFSPELLGVRSVNYLFEDEWFNLWVATDLGVYVMSKSGEKLHTFKHNSVDPYSLVNNRVRSIYRDSDGIYWIGNDGGGLHKIIQKNAFQNINAQITAWYDQPPVRCISKDPITGNLWLGRSGGGINILDAETMVFKESISTGIQSDQVNDNEITIFSFEDDKIWIGTWGGGLNIYDRKTKHITRWGEDPNHQTLVDKRIQVIERVNDTLMLIGTERGLSRVNPISGVVTHLTSTSHGSQSLSAENIQSNAFLKDGNGYWIGTWKGLNYYENGHIVRKYFFDAQDDNSLSSNHVISAFKDAKGHYWFGTFGGGLNLLVDKEKGSFIRYTEEDGLSNNVVFGILGDNNGNIWCSTNNGLSRLDPVLNDFTNFNHLDGVLEKEFWWGSSYQDDQGMMYFGGISGLVYYHPDSIKANKINNKLSVTSIKVNNEEVYTPSKNEVILEYPKNHFYVEYSNFNLRNPDESQFQFFLKGFSEHWSEPSHRNFTRFHNLKGGTYELLLRSTSSNGKWVEQEIGVTIVVVPPFWKTKIFKVLFSLVVALFVFLIYKIRIRQIRLHQKRLERVVKEQTLQLKKEKERVEESNEELLAKTEELRVQNEEIESQKQTILGNSNELELKNKSLKELNEEKNHLIGVVAHDLRSPLTQITGFIHLIKLTEGKNLSKDTDEFLDMMMESIQYSNSMVNRILDVNAIESKKLNIEFELFSLADITQVLVDVHLDKAIKKNIEISYIQIKNDYQVFADINYTKHVVENLLTNAIKFSPKNKRIFINIELQPLKGNIRWSIKDQGPGLQPEEMPKLFGRFQKLSAKPTDGEVSTGLGLSIVKKFIESMKGEVGCVSKPSQGAEFWFTLPIK